jgi:hypothetical protein
MALTGIPPPYLNTSFSKLFRGPNIGKTDGAPFMSKKAESSNQPDKTFRLG